MKSLLEFKKYAPILFVFLFLAAVFASCFFDTRKQDKAEKESQRYDKFLADVAMIQNLTSGVTGCRLITIPPDQISIPASNAEGFRCIFRGTTNSKYFRIVNYETGEPIVTENNFVSANSKLVCRCINTKLPLTGENVWYKRNAETPGWASPFFVNKYQKDSNGNIIGIDPFIPTIKGDTLLCVPSCDNTNYFYELITIQ